MKKILIIAELILVVLVFTVIQSLYDARSLSRMPPYGESVTFNENYEMDDGSTFDSGTIVIADCMDYDGYIRQMTDPVSKEKRSVYIPIASFVEHEELENHLVGIRNERNQELRRITLSSLLKSFFVLLVWIPVVLLSVKKIKNERKCIMIHSIVIAILTMFGGISILVYL